MGGRPKPTIIESVTDEDNTLWEILEAEAYVLLYPGKPVSIRHPVPTLKGPAFRYRKMLVNNLGNAKREVRRLNSLFKTTDFSYKQF
mgnify:CR=1 FL=1